MSIPLRIFASEGGKEQVYFSCYEKTQSPLAATFVKLAFRPWPLASSQPLSGGRSHPKISRDPGFAAQKIFSYEPAYNGKQKERTTMNKKITTGKTGRPKKEDQVKAIFRTVRFTPEEDERLTAKLAEFGGTRSDFIRKAALGANIKSVPSPETIKLLQEYTTNLRNIGTNLNAIAHRANTEEIKFGYLDLREAQQLCKDFSQIIKAIRNEMM